MTDTMTRQPASTDDAASTDDLGSCRPDLEAKARFRARGFVELDALWSPEWRDDLASEARELCEQAVVPVEGPRTPVAAERATGKVTPVAVGPRLEHLHEALTPLVRALAGRVLIPSFCNYGYFAEDDGTVLHLDTDATEIVLLTTALGSVGDLRVHPDLIGCTPAELGRRESDPEWERSLGVPLRYPALGVAALRGALIPHSRPAQPVATLSAVAALHYRSLF